MKRFAIALCLIPILAFANNPPLTEPEAAALKFNQWYMAQLLQEKQPLVDFTALSQYVTRGTIKALKDIYTSNSDDIDIPDADMFIKAQDFGEDWQHIHILYSDFDPVCTQVYVAFGEKQDHVVADCYVKEDGHWKIQSVAGIDRLDIKR
ncbi:hypothetical protein C9426_34580 [Serratia sp. S1B]|nr:hypothetical protein C9426_34580 [Serratia sp. S1B]